MVKDIEALFFDFDGTIADTEELHYRAFCRVLSEYGLKLSWDDYLGRYLAYTDEEFFKIFLAEEGFEANIDELCDKKRRYMKEYLEDIKLIPGAAEAIRYFRRKIGCPMCVVSGALRSEIEFVLKRFELLEFFDLIISAEDYTEGKPSPKPFEIAIVRLKERGNPFRTELGVAFEDSPYGIISAKKAGLLAVGLPSYYSKEKLREAGADVVVGSFLEPEDIERKIKRELKRRVVEGERILLVSQKRNKTFLVEARRNRDVHTHLGVIRGGDIVGGRYGGFVLSSKNEAFYILEPTIEDKVKKIERKSAVVYPKDSSFMIFISNISCGSRVIESGCGSGGLTVVLAHFVKPEGRVFVYEVRDDFIELTKRNLRQYDLLEYVEFKKRDVYKEGFDERDVDAVFLDLPEPWHCVRSAWESLKPSGVLISISPTVNQTEIMCEVMRASGFVLVDSFEVLLRRFLAREGKSRPYENMIGHTAYISVGRKIEK